MVIVTALNVLVAASLPFWSAQAQREKEEEAIFRGLQYAEAIRVFQGRFGRPPVRLQELVEVEPRSIRRLWTDPLNDNGEWGVLFAGQDGAPIRPDAGPDDSGSLTGSSGLSTSSSLNSQPVQTQGPIAGVYSRAEGDASKVFNGGESYDEWEFTVSLIQQLMSGGQQPGQSPNPQDRQDPQDRPTPQNPQNPQDPQGQGDQGGNFRPPGQTGLFLQPGAGPPDLSVRWLGRPWPEAIEQQMDPGAALNQGSGLDGSGPGGGGQNGGGQNGNGQGGSGFGNSGSSVFDDDSDRGNDSNSGDDGDR